MLSLPRKLPPVAMLHHVGDAPLYDSLKPYAISHQSFLRLLNYLERKNIQTTTFAELAAGQSKSKRRVILTFDDCSKSLLDFAIPELLKRKMKAVFYMPTAHLGLDNSWDVEEGKSSLELMNASDLVYLLQQGMEIGGHSHHHIPLDRLSALEVKQEIIACRINLESILQVPIVSFAYPYGVIPQNHAEILASEGFQYGLGIYTAIENKFCLRRFIYHDGDSTTSLAIKLSPAYKLYRTLFDRTKNE